MATTQNWLGMTIEFNKVEDRTSDSTFELLPEGFYKATIKNLIKGTLGEKEKSALIVTLELEEGKKEITCNLFLPENGDEQKAIEFKLQCLRNFFTRCYFSSLTKDDYNALSSDEKNEALNKIQTSAKGPKQFIGTNVLVHIKQDPFMGQDRETKALKLTDVSMSSVISTMPKQLLKLIQDQEEKGTEFDKMPLFLFSNRVAACGFGFYNDYDETIELKNSKSYDFVQAHLTTAGTKAETSEPTVPKF